MNMELSGMVLPFKTLRPRLEPSVFVAPGAVIVGDVQIGARSGIWYGCVVRGDVAPVRIGPDTNIQDGAVIHVARDRPQGTVIGSGVTVGHQALIHACTIGDDCLIGMQSCVMDGVVVEAGSWIAAGALVTPGKRVLSGQLWAGSPARPLRDLRPEELETIRRSAQLYVQNAVDHRDSVAATRSHR